MTEATEFRSSFNRPNLYYEVRAKTVNVDRDIIKFIKQNPEKSGIIYCLSRKKVEELTEILQANGIKARASCRDGCCYAKCQSRCILERGH